MVRRWQTRPRSVDAIRRTLVEQTADAGQLAVSVDEAVDMLRALSVGVGVGVVFTFVAMPEHARDRTLQNRGRDAVLATIPTEQLPASSSTRSTAAMRVKGGLQYATQLAERERALLGDSLAAD